MEVIAALAVIAARGQAAKAALYYRLLHRRDVCTALPQVSFAEEATDIMVA
jgi:hypothetical protein